MKSFLETERLILRQYTDDDVENLFELSREPEVLRWLPNLQVDRAKIQEDMQRYISYYKKYDGYGIWAVIEKLSRKFIGWFMFLPQKELPWFNPELGNPDDIELGFCFRKDAWGKGYATEMTKSLLSKGFSKLGTQRVIGTALAANTASIRVMEKVGMKLERKFFYEKLESIKTPAQEVVIYALDKDNFQRENNISTLGR